ncbi:hypothetical protein BC629DRAFT_1288495 [Irpex lacteus]|nr:hypothetical protein BC629DRAFT_1288495 [Irpex lacteus]
MTSTPAFLFEPPSAKTPRTARKVHIRRLYDVLQLSLHRGDIERARRAWCILIRCKELDWMALWRIGVLLASAGANGETRYDEGHDSETAERLEYLSTMMRHHSEEREAIFQEFVLLLIKSAQYERALDELELYLPSPPYQDNPVLHLYAGLLCLYLAQPIPADGSTHLSRRTLRDAEHYLQRTRQLDPENTIASAWLDSVRLFSALLLEYGGTH